MATPKEQALRLIESLPDDCMYEDIQCRLHLRTEIDRGIRNVDAGREVSQEEAERRVEQWLK